MPSAFSITICDDLERRSAFSACNILVAVSRGQEYDKEDKLQASFEQESPVLGVSGLASCVRCLGRQHGIHPLARGE